VDKLTREQKMLRKKSALVVMACSVMILSGCSQVNSLFGKEDVVDYSKSGGVKSLEVPPDLTTPEYDSTFAVNTATGTISAAGINKNQTGTASNVLPVSTDIQLKGQGSSRWLEVKAPASKVWPKVQSFWTAIGIGLKRNEPRIGVMETEWVETQAHLPEDWLRSAVSKALKRVFDGGFRDRYHLRMERISSNATRIYIAHRGAEKIVTDTGTGWETRPSKPERENEMLNRLKVYLQGGDPVSAKAGKSGGSTSSTSSRVSGQSVMTVDKHGAPVLQVMDTYRRTWVRTGSVLTRTGFTIDGQDAGKGLYAAAYEGKVEKKKKGFFKRLFSRSDKSAIPAGSQQIIQVKESGSSTHIRVLDKNGKPLQNNLAREILKLLKTEFDR